MQQAGGENSPLTQKNGKNPENGRACCSITVTVPHRAHVLFGMAQSWHIQHHNQRDATPVPRQLLQTEEPIWPLHFPLTSGSGKLVFLGCKGLVKGEWGTSGCTHWSGGFRRELSTLLFHRQVGNIFLAGESGTVVPLLKCCFCPHGAPPMPVPCFTFSHSHHSAVWRVFTTTDECAMTYPSLVPSPSPRQHRLPKAM